MFSGKGGSDYFFEAQKIVYQRMEEKFYRDFVLSRDYMEYICQSESAMDELRAHLPEGEDESLTLNWNDGMNIGERVNLIYDICLFYILLILIS